MPSNSANGFLSPARDVRAYDSPELRILIDFDNTITMGDVLDGIIQRFAIDENWRPLEDAWAKGLIGARECLEGQFRSLRASWPELSRHLEGVNLDPGFRDLRRVARKWGVEMTILTDNFDLIIGQILRRNGLGDVPFRANHLRLESGSLIPSFPFANPECPECAHCKKTYFLPPSGDSRRVVYIGDGRSDLCPSRHADTVFAKASLLKCLRQEGVPCIPFSGLGEVAVALEGILHENRV